LLLYVSLKITTTSKDGDFSSNSIIFLKLVPDPDIKPATRIFDPFESHKGLVLFTSIASIVLRIMNNNIMILA